MSLCEVLRKAAYAVRKPIHAVRRPVHGNRKARYAYRLWGYVSRREGYGCRAMKVSLRGGRNGLGKRCPAMGNPSFTKKKRHPASGMAFFMGGKLVYSALPSALTFTTRSGTRMRTSSSQPMSME